MNLTRFPVLLEDSSRMDWTQARYRAEINARREPVVIKHHLENSPELEALLSDGSAEWVTELRCPRTLLSRQVHSHHPEQTIRLAADDILGDTYLIPGLVAVRDLELDPSGLNHSIWPDGIHVRIPAGMWLARGDLQRTQPLVASLVRFRRDPDGHLKPGQMSVKEEFDGDLPFFRVVLAQGLYDNRRESRDVQIAGLIGACGLLPRSSMGTDGYNESSAIAIQLLAKFDEADIPNWKDDEYDPARAATVMEAFRESLREEED